MPWKEANADLVQLLSQRLEGMDIERKKMFGYPVYFVNNNMFMGVQGDHIFMRLSKNDRESILEERDDVFPFMPREGRIMKEYVVLGESFIEDEGLFHEWRDRSFAYVSSLPKKEGKRKKG